MSQGSPPAQRRRSPLHTRLAGLLRPRPRLSLLPLARLAEGSRVPTEGAIRALAGATPFGPLLLCRVLGRYKMFAEASDLTLAPHLALDGYWEWWTTRFLARNLGRGETFVDAGACTGYFTLLAADLVGPEGRVLAVEPNPRSAALLRRNVTLNGFAERVTVEEAALGPAGGRLLRLVVPPESPLDAHLLKQDLASGAAPRPGDGRAGQLVRSRTLDDIAALAPDFVRLDVGDALEEAWDGMQRLLADGPACASSRGSAPAAVPGRRSSWPGSRPAFRCAGCIRTGRSGPAPQPRPSRAATCCSISRRAIRSDPEHGRRWQEHRSCPDSLVRARGSSLRPNRPDGDHAAAWQPDLRTGPAACGIAP